MSRTPHAPVRVAMWSGPRNISTAMMRAWGNRTDTFVCDEPLYAHYLQTTGRAPGTGPAISLATSRQSFACAASTSSRMG